MDEISSISDDFGRSVLLFRRLASFFRTCYCTLEDFIYSFARRASSPRILFIGTPPLVQLATMTLGRFDDQFKGFKRITTGLLRTYKGFTEVLRSKRQGAAFLYFRPTDRPEASVANSTRGGTLQDFI